MAEKQGLWQNQLFLQMLGAAGADISAGNPIGANVNAAMKEKQSNEAFRNLLASFLGPDGVPGGKATVGDKGADLHLPAEYIASSLKGGFEPLGSGEVPGGGTEGAFSTDFSGTPAPAPASSLGGMAKPNPFASVLSNLSASDMVGLTPEMMSTALTLGMKAKEVKDTSTSGMKEYRFAQSQGYEGDFTSWAQAEGTTADWKNYNKAKDGGYAGTFHEYQLEMKKAGATAITFPQRLDHAADLAGLKGETYFKDPKAWGKDLDKWLSDEDYLLLPGFDAVETPEEETAFIWDATVNWIQQKIDAGNGVVTKREWEGDTAIWTIKWPNGRTQEVRRGKK